jgi:hypothetical protein
MISVMAAALAGAFAFGGLGWWADDYSVVPVVMAIFGASFGSALAAMCLFMRETRTDAHAGTAKLRWHRR